MIRNFKALGLALVAVLAMSAVVASAAQAVPSFTASSYPAFATGSNTIGGETFTTPGGTVQCDSHYKVEKYRTTTTEGLPSPGSSTVTVTPEYTDCVAFGFLGASVKMNSCDYEFHATSKIAEGHYNHHIFIRCTGAPITIVAGTCEVTVGEQSLSSVTTQNNVDGSVTVKPNVTGITMNVVKDGFGCPFAGTGHQTGSFHGEVKVSRVGGGSISVSGS